LGIDENESASLLCYAESEDGIHWRKPALGIIEYQGSTANNAVLRTGIETSTVFVDPKAPAPERYKLIGVFYDRDHAPNRSGIYIYTSPDGLHWKLNPTRLYPFTPDSQNQAFFDDRIGKYVIYLRKWDPLRKVGRLEADDILKPWPYDKSIAPIHKWGAARTPPPGPETPTAFSYDDQDPHESDHYTSAVVQYPWAQDAYLMFPSAYLHYPPPPKSKFSNDGPVDIQFAVSRDGVKYERVQRSPYVELGLPGQPDSGSIYMFVGMFRTGDEINQYYSAYDFTHGAYRGMSTESRIGAIVHLAQRPDGFVSLDAPASGGSFTTPPLTFRGKHLRLNMNASAMGEVLTELRDDHGEPIAGYTFAEADPLHQNNLAQSVTWKGKSDISPLAGRPVRIAFQLRSVKLYAFQFE
jgi:hypothetical protein